MVEATSDFQRARWMRDLERFLPLKSQFILSGNVRDLNILVQAEGQLTPLLLSDALSAELKRAGYHQILFLISCMAFPVPLMAGARRKRLCVRWA
jgi:hypothetical protein